MTRRFPARAAPAARARILLLTGDADVRHALRATFDDEYEMIACSVLGDGVNLPLDLCIVGAAELPESLPELERLRRESEPLVLPVLLVQPRGEFARLRTAGEAAGVVDDVVTLPLDALEVGSRVRTLLRTRSMSRSLAKVAAQRQAIVRRLQAASLPQELPDFRRLRFDVVCRSASSELQLGGDWYDAMRLPDGRMVFSIGDVCGSGLDASVTAATCRQVLRGIGYVRADPTIMLEVVDRTLRANKLDTFATAFVGVFDPVTSELRYASAGHPPPMLRLPDGAIREFAADGVPLGIAQRSNWLTNLVDVPDGSLLVLYTDGLTEADRDVCSATQRLRAVVEQTDFHAASDAARSIYERMLTRGAGDDVTVAVLRVGTSKDRLSVQKWRFDARCGEAAQAARAAIVESPAKHGLNAAAIADAELMYAELVGNVVRHSGREVEVALDLAGVSSVLSVMDRGDLFRCRPKLPSDPLQESGRGLYIVSTLAEEFSVDRRSDGGTHARVVLRAATRRAAKTPDAGLRFETPAPPEPRPRAVNARKPRRVEVCA